MTPVTRLASLALWLLGGCADVEAPEDCHYHGDELHCPGDPNHGLATTLRLVFTPVDGGDELAFEWADPEGDGSPEVDDVLLPDASDGDPHDPREYALHLEVWNELEDPVEDVTPEIEADASGHQFFFTGSAVEGPATGENPDAILAHAYADADDNGLPVGLVNTMRTLDQGDGELIITLRHLPPEDGELVKEAGLAEAVAADGLSAIGGDTDIQVSFHIEVQ